VLAVAFVINIILSVPYIKIDTE
jgi:alpha-1,3-mannosyltransferase